MIKICDTFWMAFKKKKNLLFRSHFVAYASHLVVKREVPHAKSFTIFTSCLRSHFTTPRVCVSFAFCEHKNASWYQSCIPSVFHNPRPDALLEPQRWKTLELYVWQRGPFCKVPMDAASSPLFVRLAWSHLSLLGNKSHWPRVGPHIRADQFRSTSIIHLNLNAASESARAKRRRSCERLQFSPSAEAKNGSRFISRKKLFVSIQLIMPYIFL